MPPAQSRVRPWLHGHRGASGEAPENTLAAFELALRQGADGIELDVHASADGVPMVIHDPDLSRTTDRHGLVATLTATEIRGADAGARFIGAVTGPTHVPSLDEVLALLPTGRGLVIDVKDVRAVRPVVRLLNMRADAVAAVRLISFLPEAIALARQLAPWLYTGLLLDENEPIDPGIELAAAGGHQAVVPFAPDLGQAEAAVAIVEAARGRGLDVGTWVVNDRDRAAALRAAGVSFLMSDVPARLL